jgi:hypothetical protein
VFNFISHVFSSKTVCIYSMSFDCIVRSSTSELILSGLYMSESDQYTYNLHDTENILHSGVRDKVY